MIWHFRQQFSSKLTHVR